MRKIEETAEFDQLLKENKRFFFMKHSLTCPISSGAFQEYCSFLDDHPEENGYYLAVQDSRNLSNYIAEKTGITHQSPQVFLFENGQPTWNESHWKIKKGALESI